MESLINISENLVQLTSSKFKRSLYEQINWKNRLISIMGSRGVGKTTLMLQYIKENGKGGNMIYVSAEHLYFSNHTLFDFAEQYTQLGGKVLFIDEIHQYEDWSREIKVIYDSFPHLQIIFSGSSVLEINKGNADLSRRVIPYSLKGLSFREYLNFTQQTNLPVLSLEEILKQPKIDLQTPLKYFKEYLQAGYYPFFKEEDYLIRIQGIINKIIDTDLVKYAQLKPHTGKKLKRLLSIIAANVPFKPNMSKLAELTEISPRLLPEYFDYLEKAGLIKMLNTKGKSIRILGKADKIYLNNTNLSYAITSQPDLGSLRETFLISQISDSTEIYLPKTNGDFTIKEYTFEVGGKGKASDQIKGIKNSFLVKDDIETGFGNIIPLWKFGFLY